MNYRVLVIVDGLEESVHEGITLKELYYLLHNMADNVIHYKCRFGVTDIELHISPEVDSE